MIFVYEFVKSVMYCKVSFLNFVSDKKEFFDKYVIF